MSGISEQCAVLFLTFEYEEFVLSHVEVSIDYLRADVESVAVYMWCPYVLLCPGQS